MSAVYGETYIAIVVGAIVGAALVSIIAGVVFVAYGLIRAFTPTHADGSISVMPGLSDRSYRRRKAEHDSA